MYVWRLLEHTTSILTTAIKSQEFWPLTSNVGIKIQKAQNCSTELKPQGYFPTFWALPFCRIQYGIYHQIPPHGYILTEIILQTCKKS